MSLRRLLSLPALVLSLAIPSIAATPGVGEHAPDFTLRTPTGTSFRLSALTAKSRVILVVMRGYPGAQCPYSLQQFNDFQQSADRLAAMDVEVLFLYPGASGNLAAQASDFTSLKALPENFHIVIDPDFTVTNQYGLRWNAVGETSYPATFIVEKDGSIYAATIGKSHWDHPTATDTVSAVNADTSSSK